jgi:hypothetical protein
MLLQGLPSMLMVTLIYYFPIKRLSQYSETRFEYLDSEIFSPIEIDTSQNRGLEGKNGRRLFSPKRRGIVEGTSIVSVPRSLSKLLIDNVPCLSMVRRIIHDASQRVNIMCSL